MSSHCLRSITILLASFCVGAAAHAQKHWQVQNPLPTGSALNDVAMIAQGSGTAVGDNGVILRTTDGGSTWKRQLGGTTNNLRGISFRDSLNGFVVGDSRTLLRTSDGGATWSQLHLQIAPVFLLAIRFFDADTGIIVGGNLAGVGIILRTTDGGASWSERPCPIQQAVNDLALPTPLDGWAVSGAGTILRTTDAGFTWRVERTDPGFSNKSELKSIAFADGRNGLAVGERRRIMRTTNAGASWETLQDKGLQVTPFTRVRFADEQNGFLLGYGIIFRSIDRGATWTQLGGAPANLFGISFGDHGHGLMVGGGGYVQSTSDSGATWQRRSSAITTMNLVATSFADSSTGIAVGAMGTIVRTTNGGAVWKTVSASFTLDLFDVVAIDATNWCIVGKSGIILRSTDTGSTWTRRVGAPNGTDLHATTWIGSANGWAAGSGGVIIRTTDGGMTWSRQESNSTRIIREIAFGSPLNGLASTTDASVLRTTDGGASWSPLTNFSVGFSTIQFIDSTYVLGWASAGVYRSTDAGGTWQRLTIPSDREVLSGSFISWREGWVSLEAGDVLHTTDSGATWRSEHTGITAIESGPADLQGISFTDARSGTIVGNNGLILRYLPSGEINAISPPHPVTPPCDVTGQPTALSLYWKPAAAGYRLQVAEQPSFLSVIVDTTLPADTTASIAGLASNTRYYWRVSALNAAASSDWSATCSFTTAPTGSISDQAAANRIAGISIHPNPAAGQVTIEFRMAGGGDVSGSIHDAAGKMIHSIPRGYYPAGTHAITLDASSLPGGIYQIRLKGNGVVSGERLVIIR